MDIIEAIKSVLPIVGTVLGVNASALIGNRLLKDSIKKDVISVGDTPDSLLTKLKKEVGLSHLPHVVVKGFNNAAYVPPKSFNDDAQQTLRTEINSLKKSKKSTTAKAVEQILRLGKSPQGGILIGDQYKNPFIVAHEVGHAVLQHEDSLAGFLQRHKDIANIIWGLGQVAGITGAIAAPKYTTSIGLGTAGLGLLTSLPTLYTEYKASKRAKEVIKNMVAKQGLPLLQSQEEIGKSMLNKALGTYAIDLLGKRVVLPLGVTAVERYLRS